MQDKVYDFLQYLGITDGTRIGLAISGGVDSVVLAYLLSQLPYELFLLHCHFHLRGDDSDQDASFVESLAQQIGATFVRVDFDTQAIAQKRKTSIQVTARELRYEWFETQANVLGLSAVATAHHADDNLETFLMHLSRGSGIDGLLAIPPKNGLYIRPLLTFSKQDILDYAQKYKLDWREDVSNQDTKYTRNKIRHQVVPNLKEVYPNLLTNFNHTLLHLQQVKALLNDTIDNKITAYLQPVLGTDILKWSVTDLKKDLHVELILYEGLKSYGFTAWEDIYNLLDAQTGKQVCSKTHILLKDRGHLLLYPRQQDDFTEFYIDLNVSNFQLKGLQFTVDTHQGIHESDKNSITLNAEVLNFPLCLRKWKQGDYFYPEGMQGKKKISKFFKDEKYALPQKERTLLLCSGSHVLWVIGKRRDRKFLSRSSTEKVIHITVN